MRTQRSIRGLLWRVTLAALLTLMAMLLGVTGASSTQAARPVPSVEGSAELRLGSLNGHPSCFVDVHASLTDVHGPGLVTFTPDDGINPVNASFRANQPTVSAFIAMAPDADVSVTITVFRKNGAILASGVIENVDCTTLVVPEG